MSGPVARPIFDMKAAHTDPPPVGSRAVFSPKSSGRPQFHATPHSMLAASQMLSGRAANSSAAPQNVALRALARGSR